MLSQLSEERKYKWYEMLEVNILKIGPIPKHVAFIMDGNRRFAQSLNIPTVDSYAKAFDKFVECWKWCTLLGVKEVTMYAFSIENFNRSEEEIDVIMTLCTKLFRGLIDDTEWINDKGLRIRVIGNIKLAPIELQEVIAKLTLLTENNDKLFLNIALCYTSHEEITNAIQTILEDCGENLRIADINEELIRQCLYTRDNSEPDLLIRTAGNTRISDFLTFQTSSTVLYFTRPFWPVFKFWHFLNAIIHYQCSVFNLCPFKKHQLQQQIRAKKHLPKRVKNFLQKIDARRREFLVQLINKGEQ